MELFNKYLGPYIVNTHLLDVHDHDIDWSDRHDRKLLMFTKGTMYLDVSVIYGRNDMQIIHSHLHLYIYINKFIDHLNMKVIRLFIIFCNNKYKWSRNALILHT